MSGLYPEIALMFPSSINAKSTMLANKALLVLTIHLGDWQAVIIADRD